MVSLQIGGGHHILRLVLGKFLSLNVMHIPRQSNLGADLFSRDGLRPKEWRLYLQTVNLVFSVVSSASMDRCSGTCMAKGILVCLPAILLKFLCGIIVLKVYKVECLTGPLLCQRILTLKVILTENSVIIFLPHIVFWG